MSEVTLIRELVRALERARRDTKDVFQNRFLTNNCARNIRTEPIYTPCLCGTGAQIYIYLNTKYNNKKYVILDTVIAVYLLQTLQVSRECTT